MMALSCTFNNLPAVPRRQQSMSDEMYTRWMALGQQMYNRWSTPPRCTLARSDYTPVMVWLLNQEALTAEILAGKRRVVSQEEFLAHERQEVLARQQVEEPQPVEPEPQPYYHQTFTPSLAAFHGWRKVAMYVIGLLDNVCHVGRVGA